MFGNKIIRVLKKRVVLGTIFAVSFVYCFLSFVREFQSDQVVETDVKPILRPDLAFRWLSATENNNASKSLTCRNSIQGKVLITDDKGYVCSRNEILPSGCCNLESVTTQRYKCETCQSNGCCSIYEYCISCCLNPDKKVILQAILGKASETFGVLFASVTDHFELCLTKCRTSSQSVQHENSYRDPKAKHCYGDTQPVVMQPSLP